MENLIKLTTELKAEKKQWNAFGKYSYRNIEDIMEAAKPLLHKYGLKLTFYDVSKTVIVKGVQTTAIISHAIIKDSNGLEIDKATGIAGVEDRKGMDLAQSFGSSTSYARKYAVGSLFNLDDTKDADATNKHGKTVSTPKPAAKVNLEINTPKFIEVVNAIKGGYTMAEVESKYNVSADVKKEVAKALAKTNN